MKGPSDGENAKKFAQFRRMINGEVVSVPRCLEGELLQSEAELDGFLERSKAGEQPTLNQEQVDRAFEVAKQLARQAELLGPADTQN